MLEVFAAAATAAATHASAPVRRVVDVGSGPGVGTCVLAVRFPSAQVIAVDSSVAMLERVADRARRLGVADRVSTRIVADPAELSDLPTVDVAFASMSLHHLADPAAAIAAFRRLLAPAGLLVVVEHGPQGGGSHHAPTVDARALLSGHGFVVLVDRVVGDRTLLVGRSAPRPLAGD